MLDVLLEFIFEFLWELFFQALVEIGLECLGRYFHQRPILRNGLAFIAIALLGGFVGLIFSNTIPWRIMRSSVVPGISLVLVPLVTGSIMKFFGDWRRSRGHQPTVLASFWGGALFAFSMALVRWLRIG